MSSIKELFPANRIRSALRSLKRPWESVGLILLYHRVAQPDVDPWSLCVSPSHFAQQMEALKQQQCAVSLSDLALNRGRVRRRGRWVAVTFDDGYADNLLQAKPLLELFEIPATFFVSSYCLDRKRNCWWDQLNLLIQPTPVPPVLELRVGGESLRWDFGISAMGLDAGSVRWKPSQTPPPTPRHVAFLELYGRLRLCPDDERERVTEELQRWAGAGITTPFLTSSELRLLAKSNLVEIGGHTETHSLLSRLPPARQRVEIESNKQLLEQLLGRRIESVAFPYGDFSQDTLKAVVQSGCLFACSTRSGTVRRKTDRLRLPRVVVQDWDGDEFCKRLSGWLEN